MTLDQVLDMGYFAAYRLWSILDEIEARDFQRYSLLLDFPHQDKEYRDGVLEWLNSKQTRTHISSKVPKEVFEQFAEAFNNG